jgi:hypothetical protein
VVGYAELMERFPGATFDSGRYRLHDAAFGELCDRLVEHAFPKFAGRVHCFADDWMGRQLALDLQRIADGEPQILLFDAGSDLALEVPHSFSAFHELVLPTQGDTMLEGEMFSAWSNMHPDAVPLQPNECVGYVVEPFLGGAYELANLSLIDLEVSWELVGQLLRQTRGVPPGTRINIAGLEHPGQAPDLP